MGWGWIGALGDMYDENLYLCEISLCINIVHNYFNRN